MKSTITNESTTDAAVNAPQSVTLYAQDGEEITVASDKAEVWLARGFSRLKTDPAEIAEEIDALLPAVGPAWRAYLDAVVAGEALDPAAQVTAHAALNELTSACNRLHLALHTRYEPAPSEPTQEDPS
jgi:hypothetical protein